MKKTTRILTLVVSAALTYGALYATLGKDFKPDHRHNWHEHFESRNSDSPSE